MLDYFRDIDDDDDDDDDDDGIKAVMKTIKVVTVMVAHNEGGTLAGVLENRVLRRIFGSRRDEVTRECRNLYNEEPNNLYFS